MELSPLARIFRSGSSFPLMTIATLVVAGALSVFLVKPFILSQPEGVTAHPGPPTETHPSRPHSSGLDCAKDEPIAHVHNDFLPGPGGPRTPEEALRILVGRELPSLPIQSLEKVSADVQYASFQYRKNGRLLAEFNLEFLDDTWAVRGSGCNSFLEKSSRSPGPN